MSDLSENSKSYYNEANIYKIFSDAEDASGHIFHFLKSHLQNKKVLDLGCGNGKYTKLLSNYCDILGLDKATGQLQQAKNAYPQLSFIQADCLALPFYKSFDVIIACWMLGTLIEPYKQLKALEQMKYSLKDGGEIILIENDTGSEFEAIRARDKDKRTEQYNQFLLDNGFKVREKIQTQFEFPNTQLANQCLSSIWGDKIQFELTKPILEHKVVIFSSNI